MIFLVAPVRAIVMRACVPFLRSVSLEMERLLFSGCMMTLKIQRVVLKKSPKKICLVSSEKKIYFVILRFLINLLCVVSSISTASMSSTFSPPSSLQSAWATSRIMLHCSALKSGRTGRSWYLKLSAGAVRSTFFCGVSRKFFFWISRTWSPRVPWRFQRGKTIHPTGYLDDFRREK